MTVCTASMFTWNYAENDPGLGIFVASDRMYSDNGLGIEYESSRTKVAYIDLHRMVLVAGDLSMNSRAIAALMHWKQDNLDANTSSLAIAYGQIVAALSFERAAKFVLNPLGIFTDEVITDASGLKKYGLPDSLVINLAEQLQDAALNAEAIIAGVDKDRQAHLYRIDGKGCVTRHDDIGFVSIGNGGIHSSAYFMQMPFNHNVLYAGGLISTYFAKKRSEVAPGVGTTTDMSYITANGRSFITEDEIKLLEATYQGERRRLTKSRIHQANKFFKTMQRRQASASDSEAVKPSTPPNGNNANGGAMS